VFKKDRFSLFYIFKNNLHHDTISFKKNNSKSFKISVNMLHWSRLKWRFNGFQGGAEEEKAGVKQNKEATRRTAQQQ